MALIHKNKLSVKTENSGKEKSFEYLINSIKNRNYKFHILSVYHPPYSINIEYQMLSSWMILLNFSQTLSQCITMC